MKTSSYTSQKIVSTLKPLIVSAVLFLGASALFAQTTGWTPPPSNPPNNNVAAPLNISSYAQSKVGPLAVGSSAVPTTGFMLDIIGPARMAGLLIDGGTFTLHDGTQCDGCVLTSDGNGHATWRQPSGGATPSILSSQTIVFDYASASALTGTLTGVTGSNGSYTWTVPAGVTQMEVEVYGAGGGAAGKWCWHSEYIGNGGTGGAGKQSFDVSAGQVYTLLVGAGGAGGSPGCDGAHAQRGYDGGVTSVVGGSVNLYAVTGKGAIIYPDVNNSIDTSYWIVPSVPYNFGYSGLPPINGKTNATFVLSNPYGLGGVGVNLDTSNNYANYNHGNSGKNGRVVVKYNVMGTR